MLGRDLCQILDKGMGYDMFQDAPLSDWTKPAAMAIPKGGTVPDNIEQGRYGAIFPRTPA